MTVRRRVHVDGRVQGVFFRDSCARQARALGVTGWIRNTGDGRVEGVFEGEPESVEQMVSWCYHGPSRAMVTNVQVIEEEPRGDQSFVIR